jgi:hypothetical protein
MNHTLHLCCNDDRNGLFQGYVNDVCLDLPDGETIELNGPRVSVSFIAETEIRIGRTRSVMLAYREWVGNWCWDCVKVSDGSARKILNYLKERGWSFTAAPTNFFDRWEEEGAIEPEEWRELFERINA